MWRFHDSGARYKTAYLQVDLLTYSRSDEAPERLVTYGISLRNIISSDNIECHQTGGSTISRDRLQSGAKLELRPSAAQAAVALDNCRLQSTEISGRAT